MKSGKTFWYNSHLFSPNDYKISPKEYQKHAKYVKINEILDFSLKTIDVFYNKIVFYKRYNIMMWWTKSKNKNIVGL